MFENGIRGGISQAIHKYVKANNKYMKSYNKRIVSSYLQYLDANNLYGWAISKKLPIGGFKWDDSNKYTEVLIKNYDEDDKYGCVLEIDIEYPEELRKLHRDLPFLCHRKKIDKTTKLITSFEDKKKYVVHISALKQALNHGLKLKNVYRVIQFIRKAWMKKYIKKNTELRMNSKNEFEKTFYKLMNNSAYGKTMENVRKHRDIRLVTTNAERKKLASEPNYHTCKHFSENLIAVEMKKTKIYMKKPVYIGQAVLDISKTLMYEFWYDYIKPKYEDKAKLCYMDTDSFIMYIETEDFYKDISDDVKERFDTSEYPVDDKRLPIGLNKKVIGKMKDELKGQIMSEFVALASKVYAYVCDNDKIDKRVKGIKKCVRKKVIKFQHYMNALLLNITMMNTQQRFKSDHHIITREEINKISLSRKDDKRIQSFDGIHTYPIGIVNDLFNELENEIRSKPIPLYCEKN